VHGVNILGAKKVGDGAEKSYRNASISYVQEQKVSLTRQSIKTHTAYVNYKWFVDKDGKTMNEPDNSVHEWSNPMDAIRYGIDSFRPKKVAKHRAPRQYDPISGRLQS